MLVFSEKSQASVVLQKSWFIDSSPIRLKLRNPTFDAASERLNSIPIWVRLSSLPPHLWNEKCFQDIGNHLGKFLVANMGFIDSAEMSVARIMVLLNIREGLKEFHNLTHLGRTRIQILDYEGVPFYCKRCHEYGHIVKDCKSTMKERRNNHSTSENRVDKGISASLGASTPSSGSSTRGTNPCEPAASRIVEAETSTTQEGDTLALIPARRDVSASKACSEPIPQFLLHNLLGMHLNISRSVNGIFKDFSLHVWTVVVLPRSFPPQSFRP